MLVEEFSNAYNVFKRKFYESLCQSSTGLTMSEAFSLDIIYMLDHPTILEYATYMGISQSNATYKINQMISKGFLTKTVCENDKRAFSLSVTDRFLKIYRETDRAYQIILNDLAIKYSKEEIDILSNMLREVAIIAEKRKY